MENKELKTDLFRTMKMFEEHIFTQHFGLYQRQMVMEMLLKIFPENNADIALYAHIKCMEEDINNSQN